MNFKSILRPLCWIDEIYLSIKYDAPISGHDYYPVYDFNGIDILYYVCERCGKVSH